MEKLSANIDPLPTSPCRIKILLADEEKQKAKSPKHIENSPPKELREPAIEQLYKVGSLGNTLPWGDQQILEPVDEVPDIHEISYDRKMKFPMRRIVKKMKLMLDRTMFINIKEMLFYIESAKMTKLIKEGMAITDATLHR
jgi:hypothetical protein